MDVPREDGEQPDGFMPGDMMLTSLVGCSGVDVVEILRKQRQQVTGIDVRATGVQEPDPPWTWVEIRLEYGGDGQERQRGGGRAGHPALGDEVLCSVGSHALGPGQDKQHLQDRRRMSAVHDMGGRPNDDPIDRSEHTP